MAASSYVGRVGGLAVAFGIGVALAIGHAGSAWADAPGDTAGVAADRGPAHSSVADRSRHTQAPVNKRSPAPASSPTAVLPPAVSASAAVSPSALRARSAGAAPVRTRTAASVTAAAVSSPSANAGGTPTPAGNPPGNWGLLATIRREFFNTSPTVTPVIYGQTTSGTGQAVVTGNLGAADADGDTLHYTYIGTPQSGGTLDVDQSTGNFTYTAPSTMNSLGGLDQFNIVVSDQTPGAFPTFHGIVDLLSYVPVFGPQIVNNLQLFGLATPYTSSVPARVAITVTPTEPAPLITGDPQVLSANPVAAQDGWQRYVLTPQGCSTSQPCSVSPVSLYYKNDGVTVGDNGEITLTYALGAQAPMVILDYGQDVGGYTRFSYYGATPNLLQASYSESTNNLSAIGDGAASSALLANSGDPLTFQMIPVIGNGSYQGNQLQGGFRYQRIVLNLPGTITLTNIATELTAPLRSSEEYAGRFLSNSDQINRIWYAGAYTVNLDEIPSGTPGFAGPYPLSILGEAAKRDRGIWAGDLLVAAMTAHDVLGAAGDTLIRNNLQIISDNPVKAFVLELLSLPVAVPTTLADPGPAAGVCSGVSHGGCKFWGASYSMALAQNMGNYYTLTGDTEFVRDNWAAVQRAVTYGNSLINPSTGLVDVPAIASLDWSVVGRAVGQVASTNMIQYNSLTNAAILAEAIGDTASAAQYIAEAAALKAAINANLWNPAIGAYDASTDRRGFVVQDANSWAVLYGVADADQAAQIVQTLSDSLTTGYGLRAAEEGISGYPQIVSPFIGSFTLPANYLAGRPDLAMQQMVATWGYMVDSSPGTTWERINLPNGDLSASQLRYLFGDSASHAWSTGATSALSDYVLGVTPTDVAYRGWQVKPFPQGLTFAQGRVPTAQGAIGVRWDLSDTAFRMTVEAPNGAAGTVAIPKLGAPRIIYRNGSQATSAYEDDSYAYFTGVTGSNTWAWSTSP